MGQKINRFQVLKPDTVSLTMSNSDDDIDLSDLDDDVDLSDLDDDPVKMESAPFNPDTASDLERTVMGLPPKPEERGFLGRMWDKYNEPLTDAPSRAGKFLGEQVNPSSGEGGYWKGLGQGMLEGAGDVVSGLTSPSNILPTLTGAGAAKTGLSSLYKATRGLSGLTAAHGGQEVIRPDATLAERGMGLAELVGGLAGTRFKPKPRSIDPAAVAGEVAMPESIPIPESFGPDAYAGPERRSGEPRIPGQESVFNEYRERLARGEDVRSPEAIAFLEQKNRGEALRQEAPARERIAQNEELMGTSSDIVERNGVRYQKTGINPDTGAPTYKPIQEPEIFTGELPNTKPAGVSPPRGIETVGETIKSGENKIPRGFKVDKATGEIIETPHSRKVSGFSVPKSEGPRQLHTEPKPTIDVRAQWKIDANKAAKDIDDTPGRTGEMSLSDLDELEKGGNILDPNNSVKEILKGRGRGGEEYLKELKNSILENGIKEPITLREMGDGSYTIFNGRHRLAAAESLGIEEGIPVTVISKDFSSTKTEQPKKPTAKFAYENTSDWDDGPPLKLYRVEGGLLDGSDVSAATLRENGIDVPPDIVKADTVPASQSGRSNDSSAKLPSELKGAKPRFNMGNKQYQPEFESDLDKALFIIAQKNASKADASYLKFAMDNLGVDEGTARAMGSEVKTRIKALVKNQEPGVVKVPKIVMDSSTMTPEALPKMSNPIVPPTQAGGNVPPNVPPNQPPIPPIGGPIPPPKVGPEPKPPTRFENILNISKTLKSSMDFSAPLRQGLPLIHKAAWWNSLDDMVKAWGSQGAYDNIMKEIVDDPSGYFKPKVDAAGKVGKSFAEEMGLDLTDVINNREESMISTMLDKVPGIKRSNRAYTAFLNKLRADSYKTLLDTAKKSDPSFGNNQIVASNLAKFVNNATGRGSLGSLEPAAKIINGALFAPKLIAGNIQRLNPKNYIFNSNQGARIEYLKSMAATVTAWTVMAGMIKGAGEAGIIPDVDVSLDPTSSDFGKARIGDTRFDASGGLQTYVVAFARMTPKWVGDQVGVKTGQFTNTSKETTQFGEGYPTKTKWDVASDFVTNKASPPARLGVELLKASDYKPFNTTDQVARLFVPMIAEDAIKLAKSDPELMWMIPAAGLGAGVQTFNKNDNKKTLFGYKEPFPIK